ncbi:flagellar assembly peptidoglycan hydrolase FlgJ [Alkalimonas collagenimarina]|uniref:Peptidoglycan hydrolase FlgJ n=1 Tax=Alkalimonas collagenimarina TaxID=400390 RepID=A0ABT9GY41_9GAMM|nr:flagellar assembly peptidoglycan hydrolase FlgJ [Alkalimonas collagenimarina]MDP4535883.1 flagellar assembly peptidoglycan hydrolase FlgJ [Alkalimonas collagenimarina]
MDSIRQPLSYHDINSLQQIRQSAGQDEGTGLRQAAEQFEAIFMNMLLSSMRKANEAFKDEDGFMHSETTKFYEDMYDNQLASDLSRSGSLGLADIIVQQLSPEHIAQQSQRPNPEHLVMPSAISTRTTSLNHTKNHEAVEAPTARTKTQAADMVKEAMATVEPKPVWSVDSPKAFVERLLPAAREAASALGLDPVALVAQAALETGWGQRMIPTAAGENSFNLFGIKASRGWQGDTAVVDTLEYRQGVAQKEQAKFRAYDSPEQSLKDYVDFIQSSPRYQEAVKVASDSVAYFRQLQAAGYATDPNYAEKIRSVMNNPVMRVLKASAQE